MTAAGWLIVCVAVDGGARHQAGHLVGGFLCEAGCQGGSVAETGLPL